ncbi:hypothetical protein QZH46_08715 [Pseudomonas corrugata]
MIWESWYWKQPLLEMADRLEHLKTASTLSDEELAQVERDIFIGFYSVRKLLEAPAKITDKTRHLSIPLHKHPNLKRVTWRNNHRLGELYDLSKTGQEGETLCLYAGGSFIASSSRPVSPRMVDCTEHFSARISTKTSTCTSSALMRWFRYSAKSEMMTLPTLSGLVTLILVKRR